MGAAWLLVRAELRGRRRGLAGIALLVALLGGSVIAAVAGADRTRTALARFAIATNTADALVADTEPGDLEVLASLDGVRAVGHVSLFAISPTHIVDGGGDGLPEVFLPMAASTDGRVPYELNRARVVAGRRPDPSAVHEVALREQTAQLLGVGVGDALAMASFTAAEVERINESQGEAPPSSGPPLSLEVVGIVRDPFDVVRRDDDIVLTFLTPAFAQRYRGEIGTFAEGAFVDLEGTSFEDFAAAAGAVAPATLGLSLARAGGGARARTVVAQTSVTLGVAAVVAAAIFAASLAHLVATPRLYGWSLDTALDQSSYDPVELAEGADVAADPAVPEAAPSVVNLEVSFGGVPEKAFALGTGGGQIVPVVARGRPPGSPDEVAVGRRTLSRLGAGLGDDVAIDGGSGPQTFEVVGQAVLPVDSDGANLVSEGVALTMAGAARLGFDPGVGCGVDDPCYTQLAVRWTEGADLDAARQRLRADPGQSLVAPGAPAEVERSREVRSVPWVLAGLLCLLAVAATAHAVWLAVRTRRRDPLGAAGGGAERHPGQGRRGHPGRGPVRAAGPHRHCRRRGRRPVGVAGGGRGDGRGRGPRGPARCARRAPGGGAGRSRAGSRRAGGGGRPPAAGANPEERVMVTEAQPAPAGLAMAPLVDEDAGTGHHRPRWRWALAALALAALALTGSALVLLAGDDRVSVADALRGVLTVSFTAAGLVLGSHAATRRLGALVLAGVTAAAAELLALSWILTRGSAEVAEAVHALAGPLVIAVAFHVLVALPDGRLPSPSWHLGAAAAYGAAVLAGVGRWRAEPSSPLWPVLVLAAALGLVGLAASNRRYVRSRGLERQRMQWLGVSLALVVETALVVAALRLLIGWPPRPAEVVAASLVVVAGAMAASVSPRLVVRVDRLLAHAVAITGLTAVIIAASVFVVIGLGRVPTGSERPILVLSMTAAALCTVLYGPARDRLTVTANRLVFGESRDPTQALDTFGGRMTRALPMDELLLQLVELCKKHYDLRAAEVWTGTGGRLARAASVPDRGPGVLALNAEELAVVSRAGLCGRGWATVWLPQILEGRGEGPLRVAPMTHSGQLFGILVLERREGDAELGEEDGQVLTELARQVGLALQNSELDSALRATLEEVQRKNVELAESRARIVASGDAERRRIERNLHDGAQQHLVALAVKLRLVQRLGESDPAAALALVEEARDDVLTTVEEVRALAHGIYPPLLMDKGLPAALAAAAGRASLPTTVDVADDLGRFPQEVEAAVYFCCLEALQNAAKHAGEAATARLAVEAPDGAVAFSVSDDGRGFDAASQGRGHGFVNMEDRLAALGGRLDVRSAPGDGTTISGRVPVKRGPAAEPAGPAGLDPASDPQG